MADDLTRQFDKLSNQARFVQMIVNKELSVSNKKKKDLEVELRGLKFKGFAKAKKALDAGEDEPVPEEEEEGQAGEYDYLLGMAIWSLTKEKVSISSCRMEGKSTEDLPRCHRSINCCKSET